MAVIDLNNCRIAKKELEKLLDWLTRIPMMGMATNSDFHSLELALDLIDDEIRRFERKLDG